MDHSVTNESPPAINIFLRFNNGTIFYLVKYATKVVVQIREEPVTAIVSP